MKNQTERIRRAALKRAGIAVCDMRCRTCGRAVCTGARAMAREEAAK